MLTYTVRVFTQILRGLISPPQVNNLNKTVNVNYRCWPLDIDVFLHMNNAKYLHVAELSRWRTLTPIIPYFLSKRMIFLATENNVKYIRPINPLQRYVVSTTVTVDKSDDKWIHYNHVFEEHPEDVHCKNSNLDKGASNDISTLIGTGDSSNTMVAKPKIFAVVNTTAVVKESNGKTVKPSLLTTKSDFFQEWIVFK